MARPRDRLDFGTLLKRQRVAAGLTQEELAERAGLSIRGISDLERGARKRPRRDTVLHLLDALAVSETERTRFEAAARAPAGTPTGAADLPSKPPGDLPVQPTAFVGRTAEVAAVGALLLNPLVRLLTLTGPGGTGKTRLALQVAEEARDDFPYGLLFVPLSAVSDPSLVRPTIAQALGLVEDGQTALADALQSHLRDKRLLLVLDNFEQIVAAAPTVNEILASAPECKALVTSRSALRVRGEREFPVPALAVPDPQQRSDVDALRRYDAVRLFVERAREVRPDFAVTEENGPVVAEICRRLDGLPLAIELAAARIRLLPPPAMLERLTDRLALLAGGARDMPDRHRTMRASIGWSHGLLAAPGRRLFANLSVFAGGATLQAIEAVCAPAGATDPLCEIEPLVESSLLRRDEGTGGEPRFVMLETVREYALERLAEAGARDRLRRRHAEYFLELAEAAQPELRGPHQARWQAMLEDEYANLRTALAWALESKAIDVGLRLATALERFWSAHGHLGEGFQWLSTFLALGPSASASVRAKALNLHGWLGIYKGEHAVAQVSVEESLALFRDLDDRAGAAAALNNLGSISMFKGDYDSATAFQDKSLAIIRELGDTRNIATMLNNQGNTAMDQGDWARAVALHSESLALRRGLGDEWLIAVSLNNLASAAIGEHAYDRAITLIEESLGLFRDLGDNAGIALSTANLGLATLYAGDPGRAKPLLKEGLARYHEVGNNEGIAYCLEGLAGVSLEEHDAAQSARLVGVAESLRETIDAPLPPSDQDRYRRHVAASRTQLGDDGFDAAYAVGRRTPLERAVRCILNGIPWY